MADIACDHREVFVLAAVVEAEPQAEAVGQRHLLLDRLVRIDRRRALVLDHVARQEMAAVRGGIEDDVVGPPLDAAFERRLQRLVRGVVGVEGEIVAEENEAVAARRGRAPSAPAGSRCPRDGSRSSLAARAGMACVDPGMDGLDERALAHAARAPQQRIVGRQARGEPLGVLEQDVADPVDALEEVQLDPVDLGRPAAASCRRRARRRRPRRRNPAPAAAAGAARSSACGDPLGERDRGRCSASVRHGRSGP